MSMSWIYRTIDNCKISHVLFVVALSLFLTHFLDYSKWNSTLGGQLGHILFIVIFFLFFFSRDQVRNLNNPFKFELGVFAITPFLTYISHIYIWRITYGNKTVFVLFDNGYFLCFLYL